MITLLKRKFTHLEFILLSTIFVLGLAGVGTGTYAHVANTELRKSNVPFVHSRPITSPIIPAQVATTVPSVTTPSPPAPTGRLSSNAPTVRSCPVFDQTITDQLNLGDTISYTTYQQAKVQYLSISGDQPKEQPYIDSAYLSYKGQLNKSESLYLEYMIKANCPSTRITTVPQPE